MPCWEVRTMSVEFGVKHSMLLVKALGAMNLNYTMQGSVVDVVGLGKIDLSKGVAEIDRYNQKKLNQLKQAYSKECVKKAAKLQGWQLKTRGREAASTSNDPTEPVAEGPFRYSI